MEEESIRGEKERDLETPRAVDPNPATHERCDFPSKKKKKTKDAILLRRLDYMANSYLPPFMAKLNLATHPLAVVWAGFSWPSSRFFHCFCFFFPFLFFSFFFSFLFLFFVVRFLFYFFYFLFCYIILVFCFFFLFFFSFLFFRILLFFFFGFFFFRFFFRFLF